MLDRLFVLLDLCGDPVHEVLLRAGQLDVLAVGHAPAACEGGFDEGAMGAVLLLLPALLPRLLLAQAVDGLGEERLDPAAGRGPGVQNSGTGSIVVVGKRAFCHVLLGEPFAHRAARAGQERGQFLAEPVVRRWCGFGAAS